MSDINLKLLQSFLLVAQLGSFRRAAESARRSTAAISMQIKELEDQVGMRLFVRQPKNVTLTPNGRLLFEKTAACFPIPSRILASPSMDPMASPSGFI